MAKKNDFNLDDLVHADRHQQDVESLSNRIKALEDKFGTNEKIADTLCEAAEKASRMDEMMARRFLKLLQNDVDIKAGVTALVNKLDRDYFRSLMKKLGWGILSFIGAVIMLIIGGFIEHIARL